MNRLITTCALVLATALLTLSGTHVSADQTLYRWIDADGNTASADRPPPTGTEYEVISTKSSMVRKVDADEGAVPLTVKPTASNDFEQVNSSKPKIEKNPEYCERARENLTQLDTHARIRLRNDQGEIRYLSEEEKDVERQKAKDSIQANCE